MTIAFIPARGGSKSIKHKNIKEIYGKPLILWNISELQKTVLVDKIVVATDSKEIKELVENNGFDKVEIYMREKRNTTDTSSTESVMLEYLDKNYYKPDDIFMLVQATSPLTSAQHFEGGLKLLKTSKKNSILSCVRSKRFYWDEKTNTPINYNFSDRPRRQDFDGYMMENGAFYASYIKDITKSKCRISGEIAIFEMPEYTGYELDEPNDWVIVESLMAKHFKRVLSKKNIKLVLTDVDGTLTDAGMYYSKDNETKKFSTYDGKGFELLRNRGIKTGILTSEVSSVVEKRARKIKSDFLQQGVSGKEKVRAAKEICIKLDIGLENVAYIGDDINCFELLSAVGLPACPLNANLKIKKIPGIVHLKTKGGEGAFREFVEEYILV